MAKESLETEQQEVSLNSCPPSNNCVKVSLPLHIPSILASVLELLSTTDLKNARLVSHQWAEEAGKILAKKTNICFHQASDVQRFIETSEKEDNFRIEFKRILESVRFTNFQFRIGDKLNDFDYTIKSSECVKFFDKFGSSIDSLEIRRGVWMPEDLDDNFFSKILNVADFRLVGILETPSNTDTFLKCTDTKSDMLILPNARTFKTAILPLNMSQDFVCAYFQKLLQRMPNLETIQLKGSLMNVSSTRLVMWIINAPTKLPLLSHMDVIITLNESEVLQLQKRHFPLKHLSMTTIPGIRFKGLWSLLTSLGTTLEDLKIDFSIRPNQPDTFPCSKDLIKLKKLSLKSFDGSLQFVHDLCLLKSLELVDCNLSSAFREECEEHATLRTLRAENCNSSAGRFIFDNVYKNIVKFFPNLTNLKLDYLSDTSLRIICNALPNLEEFVALQGIYTDEGLLGISPSLLRNASNECNLESTDDNIIQRKPNITYLKKLRTLALESPKMTDEIVTCGILSCKEIKSLILSSQNITDEAVRKLVDEMDLHSLQFRREYQVSCKMIHYAREKMKSKGRTLLFSCD